ncbi:MAG: PD-(D/E)XK nuclease family protein, partial [Burkholderiales bacterium]
AAAITTTTTATAMPDMVATPALADDDILHFPRGAAAGDCVHAVFECIDFSSPALWPQAIADTLREHGTALPATVGPQGMALRERMLLRMLGDVLQTPLPVGRTQPLMLADVPLARRLNELEFHLPSHALEAGALNDALSMLGVPMPRLAFRTLRGYLKGFIDLVFEHEGRYFVLDWKSNHLGDTPADYAHAGVEAAMVEHGYHLQALLYCVALDRLLRSRVPGYDPAQHFGGAIYLFVRGVRPGWRDASGAPTGVRILRPAPEVIARMSALFDERAA